MDYTQIILAALGAIEAIIPLLAGNSGSTTTTAIGKIIAALQQFLPVLEKLTPLIGDEAALLWQGVKNILVNLRGTATDAEQDAALDALDARVDAAWSKVLPQFDPDAKPS